MWSQVLALRRLLCVQ
uniref:Uncharacterized protein n=1 Tax=Anguilla anguilla TaxID=7936 RepID=A0A0E9XTJ1_ANGAN